MSSVATCQTRFTHPYSDAHGQCQLHSTTSNHEWQRGAITNNYHYIIHNYINIICCHSRSVAMTSMSLLDELSHECVGLSVDLISVSTKHTIVSITFTLVTLQLKCLIFWHSNSWWVWLRIRTVALRVGPLCYQNDVCWVRNPCKCIDQFVWPNSL